VARKSAASRHSSAAGCRAEFLTLIKAARHATPQARRLDSSARCPMSAFNLFYLGVVLFGFVGFAAALAYYSHR
jgi:hypothetical protein